MSTALGIETIASDMLRIGLVTIQHRVSLSRSLDGLSQLADRTTLRAIAQLILDTSPPGWLRIAAVDGRIQKEYVPTHDLQSLGWLEPDLEQMLLDTCQKVSAHDDDEFKKAMGDAAEFFVMSALEHRGGSPIHVSRLSDAHGYDIECPGPPVDRVEVKSASSKSKGKFYLSRNEFEKSRKFGSEWRLVQVVFASTAFVSDRLDLSHIEGIWELRDGILEELVPEDTSSFKWTKEAVISPPQDSWKPAGLAPDPNFSIGGFRR